MDYSKVGLKVREAEFFLAELAELVTPASRGALDLVERIGFFLSAFLSAARSIDYRLRHERPTTYPSWRTQWDGTLSQKHGELIKAMIDDRNVEVHADGSTADPRETQEHLGAGPYDLGQGGRLEVVGPPGTFPLVTIFGAEHWIKVGGTDRRAAEVCREYLDLLVRMVSAFKVAHP
jgi:hypothetical protein